MCAVIGISGKIKIELLKKLFLESQIRGRHATGVSFFKNGKVNTIKEPLPSSHFIQKYDPSDWFEGDTITMIGHCRYSTSDLNYNQPIADDTRSVVHNGVISQEMPDRWKQLYNIDCETKNDTELLFHSTPDNWPDASIAAVFLNKNKMTWTRNGKRPLWFTSLDECDIITSTEDIAIRSGLSGSVKIKYDGKDLQNDY